MHNSKWLPTLIRQKQWSTKSITHNREQMRRWNLVEAKVWKPRRRFNVTKNVACSKHVDSVTISSFAITVLQAYSYMFTIMRPFRTSLESFGAF